MIELTERTSMSEMLTKVGPKGYIHGWIFVGAPGVGAEVYHPQHGRGVVTAHDGTHATVKFHSGSTHSFEAAHKPGAEHTFEPRGGAKKPEGGDLKAEQDKRIREATHERMEQEKELSADQRAKWNANNTNRVMQDPKHIKNLSDEDLKGVDQEFARRAKLMGREGDVGKTHQAVKDELKRRGTAGKTAEKPAENSIKLTDKQREALQRIADNPRGVVAYQRGGGAAGMLQINGNAENALVRAKLIREEEHGEFTDAIGQRSIRNHWALTDKGRAALGSGDVKEPEKPSGDYEKARDAANRYDASTPNNDPGRVTQSYDDPDRIKEAIRLHTAARRLAPDAKAKAHHTDEINRHKGYLKAAEHSQQLKHFKTEDDATRAKIKDLTAKNHGSSPELYDQLADAHDHMADVHEKHGEHLKANGYGGYNSHEATAQKHREAAQTARESAANVRERQAKNAERIKDQLPGAQAKVKDWEATARRTGKESDVMRASAGHREIASHARAAGMHDLAKQHDDAAHALDVDHVEGKLKPAAKPRGTGKPSYASLKADAEAKEGAAVKERTPENLRAAAAAHRAAAERATSASAKARHSQRAEAIDNMADRTESTNRTDAVIKDPKSAKDLSDEHLTQANHDLNNRETNILAAKRGEHPEASAAVKAELARRGLPVEQPWDRLKPTERSEKYPHTVPQMSDKELAEADRGHAEIASRIGAGGRVVGTGHIAVRQEMARRAEAEAAKPENRRKAYQTAANLAPDVGRAKSSLHSAESHEQAARSHRRAAELATTDAQRAKHEKAAATFDKAATDKRAATEQEKKDAEERTRKAKEDIERMRAEREEAKKKADPNIPVARRVLLDPSHAAKLKPEQAQAVHDLIHQSIEREKPTGDNLARAERAKAALKERIAAGEQAAKPSADANELSKKARRTGTEADHAAAANAHARIANDQSAEPAIRAKARGAYQDHKRTIESLQYADEHEGDAKIHADAAAHTNDADAHRAAAESYRNAANELDGVTGTKKRATALQASAKQHEDTAADIDKKHADYVKSFTEASKASNAANRSGRVEDRKAAAEAHRTAAAASVTDAQRRYHTAEAADQLRQARTNKSVETDLYWTSGEGADKIAWTSPGAYDRALTYLGKYITDDTKLREYCSTLYYQVLTKNAND